MRSPIAATCLLAAAAATVSAGTDVQLGVGGLLSIRAADAPLREILERVEDKTGMKTIYDGTPPQQLITITLADLTPAAAIAQLLEGRGVRFAMATDRVGARVVTLFLTTVKVEIKQLPPPSSFDASSAFDPSMPPEVAEAMRSGMPTDELPPWLPQRPAWWPKPGEKNANGTAGEAANPGAAEATPPPAPTAMPSNLLPTPVPYAVSPFTPQGPGPILLVPPGGTPPPPEVPILPHPKPKTQMNAD
jgi:hypothetical protein